MKTLFSPFGRVIPVALTSGHTFVVTQEPVGVPSMYVAEAIARGAIEAADESANSGGVEASVVAQPVATPATSPAPTDEELALLRATKINEALNSMLDGANEADFTADGKPQLARVKVLAGFAVTRAEVDAAWAEVSKAI